MNRTTKSFAGLTGLALAVGAAYLFDPENGARRRSALGKQCKSTAERLNARTRVMGHDLSNRYHDASARVRTWFNPARRADDTLTKQVRMGLWREISTSRNIGVFAHDGQVILHGHVPAHEHQRVLQVVASMQESWVLRITSGRTQKACHRHPAGGCDEATTSCGTA